MTLPSIVVRLRSLMLQNAKKLSWLPPLLIRMVIGWIFIESGWGKLHDIPGTTENFVGWGVPMPHFNAILSSSTELFCGLAIFFGLFTRLAAVPLIFVMAVAIATAKWPGIVKQVAADSETTTPRLDRFVGVIETEEFMYALIFMWLAVAGAGAISLDKLLAKVFKLSDPESDPGRK
jgi:putative oxidoreductase